MKKIAMFGLAAILTVCVTACGNTPPTTADSEVTTNIETTIETTVATDTTESVIADVDYEEKYAALLNDIYDMIENPDMTLNESGMTGIIEFANWEPDKALDLIGYTIMDVSGDDIPELVVGTIPTDENTANSNIFAVYALSDEGSKVIIEGWARNRNGYLGDGRFLNEGSSGAAYSAFGTLKLSEDASGITWEEFYFTEPLDDYGEDVAIYFNTTGEWDGRASEKTDMTLDEFSSKQTALESQAIAIELTPFATLRESDDSALVSE